MVHVLVNGLVDEIANGGALADGVDTMSTLEVAAPSRHHCVKGPMVQVRFLPSRNQIHADIETRVLRTAYFHRNLFG